MCYLYHPDCRIFHAERIVGVVPSGGILPAALPLEYCLLQNLHRLHRRGDNDDVGSDHRRGRGHGHDSIRAHRRHLHWAERSCCPPHIRRCRCNSSRQVDLRMEASEGIRLFRRLLETISISRSS